MGKFDPRNKIGLRDWVTMKVIAVYPFAPEGSDEETELAVRSWFYEQNCDNEERLNASFVDSLTDEEASSLPDGFIDPDTAAGTGDNI